MLGISQYWLMYTKYVSALYLPFVQIPYKKKKGSVSEVKNSLLKVPATDLADLIRNQEISSVKVVKAYIKRIREVNPIINAVIDQRFDAALKEAEMADDLCKSMSKEKLQSLYPLLGVPFTVKETCGVKGLSFHSGLVDRLGITCEIDGAAVQCLRDAGAIPLLVSNIPELCMSIETHNLINGRTYNPYNTEYSAGGSSGGEAALVASGASIFGIGTDMLGSVRLPAMFCGVFGHRPTRPLVCLDGVYPQFADENLKTLITVGPICRYAKDLPLILKIMSGRNHELLRLDDPIDLKKLKIYYPSKYRFALESISVDKDISNLILKSVKSLSKVGATTESVDVLIDKLFQVLASNLYHFNPQEAIEASKIPVSATGCVKEYMKWMVGKSDHCLVAIHTQSMIRHKNLYFTGKERIFLEQKSSDLQKQLECLLNEDSVLILPTFPTTAFKHYGSFKTMQGAALCGISSVFNLPATSVPMGLNKEGLPIGIQIVAGQFQDRLCIAVAQYLEKEFGGWVSPK